MADEKKREDRSEGEVKAGPGQGAPAQEADQDAGQEDLSAAGPYVPPGQSEPEPVKSEGEAVTAVEPQTDDDPQGD